MDLDKIKKYAQSELDGFQIKKAVTAAKNEKKYQEQGRDVVMSDYFKTLREPLIEHQKRSDEKQDKVIENQEKIIQALEFDPQKTITESEAKIVDGVPVVNLDKGITGDYKKIVGRR